MTPFSPVLDPSVVQHAAAVLHRTGRVHIPGILTEPDAQELLAAITAAEWKTAFSGGDKSYDFSAADAAALNPAQNEALLKAVHAQAARAFQFLFDSYRISDVCEAGQLEAGPLAQLYAGLNAAPTLELFRRLTGDDRIAYVDAQATRYRPGHFLTEHDDDIAGKDRLFAYVLNLTPHWRVDWGGLLMFSAADGHVAEAFAPAWNALNILRVPQRHSVSVVASFAGAFRYSITGWMRACRP